MWQKVETKELESIVRLDSNDIFINYFKKYDLKKICDVGCGFGQQSISLALNGFEIYGCDISQKAVDLAECFLKKIGIIHKEYVQGDVCNLPFSKDLFEGLIAKSVLNYLSVSEAKKAISEISRTVIPNGIIYLTFDGISRNNKDSKHKVLNDGSLVYTSGNKKDMLWRFYSNEEIRVLLSEYTIIHFTIAKNGMREVIVVNQK